MGYVIATDYKDSKFRLDLNLPPSVSLVINDVVRGRRSAVDSEARFYLSTSIQVGYEEHELIEGRVTYHGGSVEASLAANGLVLVSDRFEIR
jgi:hypothetical protein|tara:strand:- start:651 stop:926 length:276 start_codon:yes stop_codon:yes gene_type:complete